MTDSNVTWLAGERVGSPLVSEAAVEVLEDLLERARSGQAVGVAVAYLDCDGCSVWRIAGKVSYGLLGAVHVMGDDMIGVLNGG